VLQKRKRKRETLYQQTPSGKKKQYDHSVEISIKNFEMSLKDTMYTWNDTNDMVL